jgi:hypothetical protein
MKLRALGQAILLRAKRVLGPLLPVENDNVLCLSRELSSKTAYSTTQIWDLKAVNCTPLSTLCSTVTSSEDATMLPFFLTPAVLAEVSAKAHRDAIKGGLRLWESEAIEKALCDIGVDSAAARRLAFDYCQTFVDNDMEEGAADGTCVDHVLPPTPMTSGLLP